MKWHKHKTDWYYIFFFVLMAFVIWKLFILPMIEEPPKPEPPKPTPLERKLDKWFESQLTTEAIRAIIREEVDKSIDLKFKGLISDAKRLNNYLGNSPLQGQGLTFYIAARRSGIDIRLSPSIGMIESGLGRENANTNNFFGRKRTVNT